MLVFRGKVVAGLTPSQRDVLIQAPDWGMPKKAFRLPYKSLTKPTRNRPRLIAETVAFVKRTALGRECARVLGVGHE